MILAPIALVGSVAVLAYGLHFWLARWLPEWGVWIVTMAVALLVADRLKDWVSRVFPAYPSATVARQAMFAVARKEIRVDRLEDSFRMVLKGWGQCEHALIISGFTGYLRGGGVELASDAPEVNAMRALHWATPERLTNERGNDAAVLAHFLKAHNLGVLAMGEGTSFTVLVGVAPPVSGRQFSYPQVVQLMELVSIIESALERAHFSTKAQHAEQLAAVGLLGASLAHEIRNPLVSIKTFVQLLPTHHQDPAFREKFFKLIGDEVGRIDQLTEQLLDLASPRVYTAGSIELHPILRASVDLVAAKAARRNVQFLTDFQASPDRAFTDVSAAKQVMLNLCFNAIQAVDPCEGARWVKVTTRNLPTGIEMAVEDSGPGIAPEIRPRLFQPFQTTKSTGFGLGLAICSDILANLNATISVDPALPGKGATFRVVFPASPAG